MNGIKLEYGVAIFLVLSGCSDRSTKECAINRSDWYKVDKDSLGLSSPLIELKYKYGSLLYKNRIYAENDLNKTLKELGVLMPHPRVFLSISRRDCKNIQNVALQIERTGICADTGCLYSVSE